MPSYPPIDHRYSFIPAPVAVGGVGGSGTRVIAALLEKAGVFMGADVNKAKDNLAFTLLFKKSSLWPLTENKEKIQQATRVFLNAMYFHQDLSNDDRKFIQELTHEARLNAPKDWLRERADKLLLASNARDAPEHWGWKEPNTHIFLPTLLENIPGLKYIHVARHGLDMAFSINQAQIQFWGEALTGIRMHDVSPQYSFQYWCASHRRILAVGEQMGSDFLLLNFDDFCRDPDVGVQRLISFLDIDVKTQAVQELRDMIRPPGSIGRHRDRPKIPMSRDDARLLGKLGFETY